MNSQNWWLYIPEKKLIRPISLMGLPWCGKSTQWKLLAKELWAYHVDQGNSRRSIHAWKIRFKEELRIARRSHHAKMKRDIEFRKEYVHMILEWNGISWTPSDIVLNGFVRDDIGRQSIEALFWDFMLVYFMISRESSHARVKARDERPKDRISNARKGRMRVFARNTLPVIQDLQRQKRCININWERSKEDVQSRLQDRLAHEGVLEGHIPTSKKPKKKVKKKKKPHTMIKKYTWRSISEWINFISWFLGKKYLYRSN